MVLGVGWAEAGPNSAKSILYNDSLLRLQPLQTWIVQVRHMKYHHRRRRLPPPPPHHHHPRFIASPHGSLVDGHMSLHNIHHHPPIVSLSSLQVMPNPPIEALQRNAGRVDRQDLQSSVADRGARSLRA